MPRRNERGPENQKRTWPVKSDFTLKLWNMVCLPKTPCCSERPPLSRRRQRVLLWQLRTSGDVEIAFAVVGYVSAFGKEVECGGVPRESGRAVEGGRVDDRPQIDRSRPLVGRRCPSGNPDVLAAHCARAVRGEKN